MQNLVPRLCLTVAFVVIAWAGLNAQLPAERMPATATEYARLVERELGVVPTINCGEGVRIPIHVDGVEVFDDQGWFACDNPDFKGGCSVGSRVNRLEGRNAAGVPIPEVVWVYLCRSAGVELFEQGIVSVQMIGYNTRSGATAFFEAPDADPSRPNAQPGLLRFDETGVLAGQLPGPGDPAFDNAFMPPPIQCTHCHQADPFIHDPWVDGARLVKDSTEPVIPEFGRPDSPYYVVGGEEWDRRTVHIEGNGCTFCHRAPDPDRFLAYGPHDINDFMPPNMPGSMAEDYAAIRRCYDAGPETTPGCDWTEPPTR